MLDSIRRFSSQPLAFFATLFIIVASLSLARHIFIPVSLAILLSLLLGPLVRLVQRYGLKRVPAVVVVSAAAFILLGILLLAILSQFVTMASHMQEYEKILVKKIEAMRGGDESAVEQVLGTTKRVTKELGQLGNEDKDKSPSSPKDVDAKLPPVPVVVQTDPMAVLTYYAATAQEVVRLVASVGLVIVLVIVMLIFREEMRDRFIRLAGSGRLTVTTKALDEASRRISDYILRKSIINGLFGAVVAAVLFVLGVPFAIMWGFLLATLRFIPGLGIWLSAVPPVVLSLMAFESWWPFTIIVLMFGIGELFMMNFAEPRFLGPQIGLLPVATMVSLTFWTWLWGPVGLLLAVPLTMCLAVLGKYVPQLSFLYIALSDQPAMDVSLRYYQRLLAGDGDEAAEIADQFAANRGADTIYDALLVPALSHSRRDVAFGELDKSNLGFIYNTTETILEDLRVTQQKTMPDPELAPAQTEAPVIVGCPVGDTADKLILQMIEQKLHPRGYNLEVGEPSKLSSELVAWVEQRNPDIVCLAALAPSGLAQARFVCKRLRANYPNMKIVVARLGNQDDFSDDKDSLLEAGADAVCTSIEEVSNQLILSAQHLSFEQPRSSEQPSSV